MVLYWGLEISSLPVLDFMDSLPSFDLKTLIDYLKKSQMLLAIFVACMKEAISEADIKVNYYFTTY